MADTKLRSSCVNPSCCDDRCCERGKRGKRGKTGPTGPTGTDGSTGPTGPTGAFDLASGAWTLKWSGLVVADPAGVVQSLADLGTATAAPASTNRYPFSSTRKATSFAIRTARNTLVGTTATVNLLRNGVAFASTAPPPIAGDILTGPLSEVFDPGDVVEVQIVLPGSEAVGEFATEVSMDFEGPSGATGPTGPIGTGPSNFVLKWSGRGYASSDIATSVNLADAGTDALATSGRNRYPLTDFTVAQRVIVRVSENTLVAPATVRLLKNGVGFASFLAPTSDGLADVILNQSFGVSDDIEVRVDIPLGTNGTFVALTAVVNFRD